MQDLVATLDLAAIMVRHFGGAIEFWSLGCQQLYGWTAQQVLGQPAHVLLRTEFPVPQSEIHAALLRDGEWSGDLVQCRQDGTVVTVLARKVLKRDANGVPRAVMESLVDVTALRQARADLMKLNQELEERVEREVKAREAAQLRAAHAERMQALGQLAGGIAHDFNNVLQAIQGSATLIERRRDDHDAVHRLVTLIGEAANRGASITRRMLVFAHKGNLLAEPLSAAEVLEDVREICRYTLGPNVTIALSVPEDLPPILADKGQLEVALVNMATNARDAMPEGGTITVTAALETVATPFNTGNVPPGDYVKLSMTDTGSGMDAVTLRRATEPFFTTKGVGAGTGLGLSVIKGFAEQSGGGFSIMSRVGEGTTVLIWLPAATPQRTEAPVSADAPPVSGGRTVLLVDDDPLVRDILRAELEAGDGLLVLRGDHRIDILVTDYMMPGKNGICLIREARVIRPGLPTILLTGYAGDTQTLQVFETSDNRFALLRKPIGGTELLGQVAALIERAA